MTTTLFPSEWDSSADYTADDLVTFHGVVYKATEWYVCRYHGY